MICVSSVFQTSATVQPYKGILFLQKLKEHAIQIKNPQKSNLLPKPVLSAVSVKDSGQDFLKLLKIFSGVACHEV